VRAAEDLRDVRIGGELTERQPVRNPTNRPLHRTRRREPERSRIGEHPLEREAVDGVG
jgi:hypothetical protein